MKNSKHPNPETIKTIRRNLLRWFHANARDLPWRRTNDPYAVWVSEIMLQQTQVATVIDYFNRFMKRFPTVEKLARAKQDTVLKMWEGLGYYSRGRNLHKAAQLIVSDYDGHLPDTIEELQKIPGIGRYTAGAILSIAGNQRLPILEGNTQRVFSRWISMRGSISDRQTINLLWQVAETMLPRNEPGTFNQAAMELGALVCTPKNPSCDQCPLSRICRARRDGVQAEIPGKVSNVRYEDRTEYALLLGKDDRYLLRPLPSTGRWAGLWDFPRTTTESYSSVEAAAKHLSGAIGIDVAPKHHVTTIRHSVTKYRISLHVHHAELLDHRRKPPRPWEYVSVDQMSDLPMSVTGRKIVRLLT